VAQEMILPANAKPMPIAKTALTVFFMMDVPLWFFVFLPKGVPGTWSPKVSISVLDQVASGQHLSGNAKSILKPAEGCKNMDNSPGSIDFRDWQGSPEVCAKALRVPKYRHPDSISASG
jgi:hypothetical protein